MATMIPVLSVSSTKEMIKPIMRKSNMSKLVSHIRVLAKHTWNGRHLKNPNIRDKCMAVRHG